MKKEIILSKLAKAKKVVKGSTRLSILEYTAIKDGRMKTTDLEIEIYQAVDFEGEYMLPTNKFQEIVNSAPRNAEIAISGGKFEAVITINGGRKYSLGTPEGMSIEDFPALNIGILENVGKFPQADLERLSKFIGKDDLRPLFYGINFRNGILCSTDAHKLWTYRNEGILIPEMLKIKESTRHEFTMPARAVDFIDKGHESQISTGMEYSRLTLNETDFLTCHNIEGAYPMYENVIPSKDSMSTKLIVSKAVLLAELKAIKPVMNKATKLFQFNLNGSIRLKAEDLDQKTSYENSIDGYKTGLDIEIGFNSEVFEACLNACEDDSVELEFSAPNRAVLINNVGICMPVMIK